MLRAGLGLLLYLQIYSRKKQMSGSFDFGGKAQKLWELAINTQVECAVFSGPAQSAEPPVPGPCV